MYSRIILPLIQKNLFQGKTIILYGPRQVGKTTLTKTLIGNDADNTYMDAELPEIREIIGSLDLSRYQKIFSRKKILIIDEAQRIINIGPALKILHDHMPGLQVIATGSSSFDLARHIKEPLTGRVIEYTLYPLSYNEVITDPLQAIYKPWKQWLRFGLYPDIIDRDELTAMRDLTTLANNYLYRDVLEMGNIRNPLALQHILQLLAWQVGSEVSYSEIAGKVGLSIQTLQSYIDLLEKSFVIFRLTGFAKNLRKEITKSPKIYFWDVGIRNALIDQFQPVDNRPDIGALWENLCIVERIKHLHYSGHTHPLYFWRTYDGQEIDMIESFDGKILAHEIKWGTKKTKLPKAFQTSYPLASYEVVNPENWDEVLFSE